MVSSRSVEPCPHCGVENPPDARFCGSCGGVQRTGQGPRTSDLANEPETLRDPPRDGPEAIARIDLQRELAAESAARLARVARVFERLASSLDRAARTAGITSIAVVRATAIGSLDRAKKAGTTASEHATVIAHASSDAAVRGVVGPTVESMTSDGIRPLQRREDVALGVAAETMAFAELSSAATRALDAGARGFNADEAVATLRALALSATARAKTADETRREHVAELDELEGGD